LNKNLQFKGDFASGSHVSMMAYNDRGLKAPGSGLAHCQHKKVAVTV